MTEGDVVLTPLPQADAETKARPAILLRQLPSKALLGTIGAVSPGHHARLLQRFAAFLQSPRNA